MKTVASPSQSSNGRGARGEVTCHCGEPFSRFYEDTANPGATCQRGHFQAMNCEIVKRLEVAWVAQRVNGSLAKFTASSGTTLAELRGLLSKTEWEWNGWLPRGFVSLLVAQSGMGKSTLALRLAASRMCGWSWPDGTLCEAELGPVVWVDTEASQALLLERADAWELPAERIHLPSLGGSDPLADVLLDSPEGWAAVLSAVDAHKPALLVVDALRGAHRGRENDSELVTLMSSLAALARDKCIAVLVLHHLRKANQFERLDEVTLDRIRGSGVIVQYSRVILAIDRPDPAQPERHRLSVIKSNLAKRPDPIGFAIADTGLEFGAVPEVPRTEKQGSKAMEFLRELLSRQPVLATDLFAQGQLAGFAEITLRRAKTDLGVVVVKRDGRWYWSLPAEQGDHLGSERQQ